MPPRVETETHTWASKASQLLLLLLFFFLTHCHFFSFALCSSLFPTPSSCNLFFRFCITPPLIFPRCPPATFIHPDFPSLSIFPGFRHVTLFSALLRPCFPRGAICAMRPARVPATTSLIAKQMNLNESR